jgi:hypothetical protein
MGGGEQRPWVVGSLEGGCSGARAHYWSSVVVEVGEGETVVWFVGSLRSERRHGEGRAHGEVTWALESEGKETMEVCFELRVVVAFYRGRNGHVVCRAGGGDQVQLVELPWAAEGYQCGGDEGGATNRWSGPATTSVVASVLGAFNSTTRPSGPGARVGPGRVVDWVGWLV